MTRISQRVRDAVLMRSSGLCEAWTFSRTLPNCRMMATDLHHLRSRARCGEDSAWNIIHLCRPCHNAVHAHRPGTERLRISRFGPAPSRELWDGLYRKQLLDAVQSIIDP